MTRPREQSAFETMRSAGEITQTSPVYRVTEQSRLSFLPAALFFGSKEAAASK